MSDISAHDFYKLGVKVGVRLKVDGVQSTQVNKLLELLNSESDERLAVTLVAIFAHRQANRGYLRISSAKELSDAMKQILECKECSGVRNEARKVLGIAKWVYEALERTTVPPEKIKEISDFPNLLKLLMEAKHY
ncbi:MAG: hypothetical protein QXO01_05150 [Nitrososphaerota archaeon]